MAGTTARALVLACLAGGAGAGCGQKSSQLPPAPKDAGSAPSVPAAAVELPAVPLGLPEVAAFAWRKRAGQPAFRIARAAEARAEWPAVVRSCREALAADPGHLEASWLLAAALGRLGTLDEVAAPLQIAVAGDFGKWGQASLELPALQAFLATPTGDAWRRRVEEDRARYLAALARATVVNASGDLFAFDLETVRWLRVTRTSGPVISGLANPDARKIAYVARAAVKGKPTLAVGVVDLSRGRTTRAVDLGTSGPLSIAYSTTKPEGFWIGAGSPKPIWRVLEDDHKLAPLPPKTARPSGPRLEVSGASSRLQRVPVSTVTADWDDNGLASAIRIGSSNRVVSAPSPGLIDGNTASWSPSKSHLAFVAQLDETCTPGAVSSAAYVVDAATGKLTELARAANGLAIEWASDRKLVIAGDQGVSIFDLDGGAPRILEGASNLATPRRRPRCSQEPVEEPPLVDDPEPTESSVGVEPTHGGVVEPP